MFQTTHLQFSMRRESRIPKGALSKFEFALRFERPLPGIVPYLAVLRSIFNFLAVWIGKSTIFVKSRWTKTKPMPGATKTADKLFSNTLEDPELQQLAQGGKRMHDARRWLEPLVNICPPKLSHPECFQDARKSYGHLATSPSWGPSSKLYTYIYIYT